ncbi:type VI secretion system baseplate subunit TssF [uncultured Draconibacterium sp.]|uniref:type VI secretion system baseplate subunit TssF n=1 Tax=uncultured Draconibacterium sp. TaxID=1573823 RepID=UPI0025EB2109|nr:type VI secretion system baseplate subunit TssF [uncultured Draconibacterium sp.]
MQESKEKISSRMLKNASRIWGFQDTQSESAFDPVVGLILSALAAELAKISTEIHTVESRILEKLVELLTPEPITGPSPAHAVMQAQSYEADQYIDETYQFYLNKRFVVRGDHSKNEKPVFFTPTGRYRIFDGKLKYMVSAAKMYQFNEGLEKEVIALARQSNTFKVDEFWLGIELNEAVESLENLSLFFDLRNESYKKSFYDSLSKAYWKINEKTIGFTEGLVNNKPEADSLTSLFLMEQDVSYKIIKHINSYYNKQFQTIDGKVQNSFEAYQYNVPDEFFDWFTHSVVQKIENGLLWLKVKFPQVLPADVIDDLTCSINCFPVINRHLEEFTQSARNYVNILPLLTEDVFFDVKSVVSSEGKQFSRKSFSGINAIEEGTYILRNGGVGRFDSRDSAEVINYLLELLRDESAAFSIIGADMITTELKELSQTIARLESRLKESHVLKKNIPYLLLKSKTEDDTIFVEFWTTNGSFGNKIKAGSRLFVYEGAGLSPESLVFVSPTLGGRESLETEDRVNAYRKALLSHGRIVTKEDIRALCYEHFGNEIKSVTIKKGLETGQGTQSGFSQTLDIFITMVKPPSVDDDTDLKFMKDDFLLKLEEQSANVLPYRCFINYS